MTEIATVGVDLAKSVFQVHGIDAEGAVVLRRQLRRSQMLEFFQRLMPCLVSMEACAGAHHWARERGKLGHDVRLMPPSYVKPYTINKDYMRERERRGREMFVPLAHPPEHAQADLGEAVVIFGGVEQKAHFFAMDLPHSDACFVRAYPAATAEAWVDGHVHAFAFFGRVPVSVIYDNVRCLVAKILADGTRQRATLFSDFLSHYLFRDRYGRPGKSPKQSATFLSSRIPEKFYREVFPEDVPTRLQRRSGEGHRVQYCPLRRSLRASLLPKFEKAV